MHSRKRESEQREIYRGSLYGEKGKSQPQSTDLTILSDYLEHSHQRCKNAKNSF